MNNKKKRFTGKREIKPESAAMLHAVQSVCINRAFKEFFDKHKNDIVESAIMKSVQAALNYRYNERKVSGRNISEMAAKAGIIDDEDITWYTGYLKYGGKNDSLVCSFLDKLVEIDDFVAECFQTTIV